MQGMAKIAMVSMSSKVVRAIRLRSTKIFSRLADCYLLFIVGRLLSDLRTSTKEARRISSHKRTKYTP